MVQESKLLAQTGEIILLNAENILPKYFAIYKYLESKDCSLMQPQKEFCMQIVCIQMFVNYFVLTGREKYLRLVEDIDRSYISTIHKFQNITTSRL